MTHYSSDQNQTTHFPDLIVPEKEKTQEWAKQVLRAISNHANDDELFTHERQKDYDNYAIVNGNFDSKQFEYVTKPYGMTSPARFVHYPLIMPNIELLIGDFLEQPLNFSTAVINREANVRKLEKKASVVAEELTKEYKKEVEDILGFSLSDKEVANNLPEDIEEEFDKSYREYSEEIAYHILSFLDQRQKYKNIFKRGLMDFIITSKQFYKVYSDSKEPRIRRVDPRNAIYPVDTETENVQDLPYFGEERFMFPNEIINEYRNFLSDEQVRELRDMPKQFSEKYGNRANNMDMYYQNVDSNNMKIRVIEAEWRAQKEMRVKVNENPYDPDNPFIKVLPDDYKEKKNDRIEKRFFDDKWEGAMIGHDMFINLRRVPNQPRREEWGWRNTKLSYTGYVKGNIDGTTLSLVDMTKNVELLYNLVMYHIDLTMARSGGKAIVYDVSQKPSNLKFSSVISYAKNSGIIPVESAKEGVAQARFNQFQEADFAMSQQMQQLVNLKVYLEDTIKQITGINRFRRGDMESGDKVGTTQDAISQSNLMTLNLFYSHNYVIEECLNRVVDLFRYCYNKGDQISYFLDNGQLKFFEIQEDIGNDDLGVFVENSSKAKEKHNRLLNYASELASSGSIPPDVLIEMNDTDMPHEAKRVLTEGIQAVKDQQKEQQKIQNQQQQQELKIKQQDQQLKKYEIDKKTAADLQQTQMDNTTDLREKQMDIGHEIDKIDIEQQNEIENKVAEKALEDEDEKKGGQSSGSTSGEQQKKQQSQQNQSEQKVGGKQPQSKNQENQEQSDTS